jgi:hypothetical protein
MLESLFVIGAVLIGIILNLIPLVVLYFIVKKLITHYKGS